MAKKKVGYTLMSWRYGIGNGLSTMLTTIASTYFAIFLTDAVGLETAKMAAIVTIASTVDLVSVPIVGIIMQKLRLPGGKFRPYLLIGVIGAGLLRWLSFTDIGVANKGLWFGGAYILCYIFFNFAYSAYSGIMPLMATDPDDRQAFSAAKIMCNSAGKFLFSLTSVAAVAAFGKGNDAKGYSILALVIAVLTILGFGQLFFAAKPYDKDIRKEDEKAGGQKDAYKASFWEMIKYTITKPWLIYLVGATMKGATFFIIQGLAAYYYTYVVGDKSMLTVYLSASTFLMIGGAFISPYVARWLKSGKTAYACGIGLQAVCLALAYFLGKNGVVFTALMCIGYIGYSIAHAVEPTVYANITDYTLWKSGKDLKPFMMTLFQLTPKIGTVVGNAVLGYGLVAVGFDKNNVTESAISGIRILFSALPAVLLAIGVVMFLIFPLTDDKVRELQAEIKARQEAAKQA